MTRPTRLKTLRLMKGISLEQVAKKMGCATSTISRAEQNGWIHPKYLFKYAEILGIDSRVLDDINYEAMESHHIQAEERRKAEGGEE